VRDIRRISLWHEDSILNASDATSNLDEAALVERAKARSPEAWTVIYERHHQTLYRYVHARVFDRDTAADLTSNVFVAAINGIGSYRYTGKPLLAWLYRISRNTVADHQRRALGRRGLDTVEAPLRAVTVMFRRDRKESAPADGAFDPDEMAQRLDLHRAVAKLPESQREVLILRFLVGLSTEEIARVIRKERAAVYSLHARAITSLRRSLVDGGATAEGISAGTGKAAPSVPINMVRGDKHR